MGSSRLSASLVFTLVAASASSALADPIKVGEHNEYTTEFKRWNVSTNPVGWILGSYGLSMSYGPHQNFALRADLNYFHPIGTEATGYELGVGMPIYLRRTYLGMFIEPGLVVRHFDFGSDGTNDYTSTVFGPQVLIGWHWTWDSGLNAAVAVGAGRNWSTSSGASDYDDEEIFINGYLRVGYAF